MQGSPIKQSFILGYTLKWGKVGWDVGEEIGNIIYKAYESLDIVIIAGLAPFLDSIQLTDIQVDFLVINDMAKAIHRFGI